MKNGMFIVCFLTVVALCENGLLFGSNNNDGYMFDQNNYKNRQNALLNIRKYERKISAARNGAFEGYEEELLLKGLPEGHPIEYFLEYMVLKCKIESRYTLFLLAKEQYRLAKSGMEKFYAEASIHREKIELDRFIEKMRIDFLPMRNYEWIFSDKKNELMDNVIDVFQEKSRQQMLRVVMVENNRVRNR